MTVRMEVLDLRSPDDLPLRVDLRHDPDRPVRGKVVVCHGFKGFRRWGFFPWMGEQLAAAGWMSAVMDFSHNGIGADPLTFDRLDLFASNSYSCEMQDLQVVVDHLEGLDPGPLALLGHSRAAVNVLVHAAENPQVGAVVTWNGVGRPLRCTARQLQAWEAEGSLAFTNARTGQEMRMDFGFVRDVREHALRWDLPAAAARMAAAHLIIHATGDLVVPEEESRLLDLAPAQPARQQRVNLPASTHTLGAVHPFAGAPVALQTAADLTLDWFAAHLDQGSSDE